MTERESSVVELLLTKSNANSLLVSDSGLLEMSLGIELGVSPTFLGEAKSETFPYTSSI